MHVCQWGFQHATTRRRLTLTATHWWKTQLERIRPLAGTLMHFLSEQVGVEFSSNSPWWSWAFRHASFLLNRFTPTRGATPYEILYQKEYGGAICNFGEPVFGFAKVTGKGTARWRRNGFLGGKTDPQDTYILFDGHELVLTRSIRRISTVWRGHSTLLHELQMLVCGNIKLHLVGA